MSAFIMLQNAPVIKAQPNTRRRSNSSKNSAVSTNESKNSRFFGAKNPPVQREQKQSTQSSKSRQNSEADVLSQAPGQSVRGGSVSGVTLSTIPINFSSRSSPIGPNANSPSHNSGGSLSPNYGSSPIHTGISPSHYGSSLGPNFGSSLGPNFGTSLGNSGSSLGPNSSASFGNYGASTSSLAPSSRDFLSSAGGGTVLWPHAYIDEHADERRTIEAGAESEKSPGSIAGSGARSWGQTSARSTYLGSASEAANFSNHSSKITAHKKVYNANTSQYMEYADTLDLFERKLYEFQQKTLMVQEALSAPWVYGAANEHLHTRTLNNGVRLQERILSKSCLQMLRYNYFVNFQANAHYVEYALESRRFPFMSYVPVDRTYEDILQEYKQKHSSKKSSNPPPEPHASRIWVEKGLSQMNSISESENPSQAQSAVRSHISRTGFWWDVYQDIRQDSEKKHFLDYLPSDDVARTFFMQLLDFFLQRFRMIGCEISDADRDILTLDELHELNKNCFYYLDPTDHAQISHFQSFLDLNFFQQARAFVAYVTPELMRDMLQVVTTCVCDNLRLQCYGMCDSDEVFLLLEEFTMVCVDIVFAEWHSSTASNSTKHGSTSSLFDTPIMNKDSPPTCSSSPSLSPIHENPKNNQKKKGFFQRFKKSLKK